jgi:hypothetical protein
MEAKTEKERDIAPAEVKKINEEMESYYKAEWEASYAIDRLNLERIKPGRRAKWRWCSANGKLERGTDGGID